MTCPKCQQILSDTRPQDDRIDFWCDHCKKGFRAIEYPNKTVLMEMEKFKNV